MGRETASPDDHSARHVTFAGRAGRAGRAERRLSAGVFPRDGRCCSVFLTLAVLCAGVFGWGVATTIAGAVIATGQVDMETRDQVGGAPSTVAQWAKFLCETVTVSRPATC